MHKCTYLIIYVSTSTTIIPLLLLKLRLTSMRFFHVFPSIGRAGKFPCAKAALERLFTRVDIWVLSQLALVYKSLVANLANVRFEMVRRVVFQFVIVVSVLGHLPSALFTSHKCVDSFDVVLVNGLMLEGGRTIFTLDLCITMLSSHVSHHVHCPHFCTANFTNAHLGGSSQCLIMDFHVSL